MNVEACKKILNSLLTGHKTAYNAFQMYCEYWCSKNIHHQQLVKRLFGEHMAQINNIVQKIGFSDDQQTEIVRLMLEKLGMTIEDVDSRISVFLANPTVFP